MKQLLLTAAAVLVLAACGPKQEPEQGAQNTAQDQAPEVATPQPSRVEKGIDVLTGLGFTPDFPYSVAYDMTDKNNQGINRHRVLLEVLDGDVQQAMAASEAALSAAGYVKSKETVGDGRTDAIFSKRGQPTLVFMAQTKERGPALKDPDAVGSIHIMWNFY